MFDRSFWKGRRVFLTGHTGFKGSWLSLWLHSLGAETTGYALSPPTQLNHFEQATLAQSVSSIIGDVRDFNQLKSAIKSVRPEVVIHMAAQSVVRKGYEDPIETYSSNVMGTVNLFEAVRQLKHPCVIVNVTSDKCYDNKEWAWGYRESDALGGHDPYSNSKACAELVASAFCDSYFRLSNGCSPSITVASARAGNVIGGGDWTRDQLIPDLIRSFIDDKPCVIRSPFAIRPWEFVLEPLRGYLILAQKLAEDPSYCGSAWNFGPADDDARQVSWIADRLVQLWGGSARWQKDSQTHPHEAHFLKLDVSKSKAELKWRPAVPLNTALEWIVEWYLAFQKSNNMRHVSLTQIERYEALVSNI